MLNIPIDLAGVPDDDGVAIAAVSLPQRDSQKSDSINPRVALDFSFNDDVLFYGSAAKGTKPGGFGTAQMSLPQIAKMDQETLYAYELGAKTTWLDQSLRLNGALFFNQYKDRQVGVTVTDPDRYAVYAAATAEPFKKFGARILARGLRVPPANGKGTAMGGPPSRFV